MTTSTTTVTLDELQAELARLRADLDDLTAAVIPTFPHEDNGLSTTGGDAGREVTVASSQEDGSAQGEPAFLTLQAWVDGYFSVVFTRPVNGEHRWCNRWQNHPEAVTRLEALWRSWETLRLDPNLGIATWLTSFLDPQLAALTSRSGPFAACTPDRHHSLSAHLSTSLADPLACP